jgi:hypothetical protein
MKVAVSGEFTNTKADGVKITLYHPGSRELHIMQRVNGQVRVQLVPRVASYVVDSESDKEGVKYYTADGFVQLVSSLL